MQSLPASRGSNVHVIGAISCQQVVKMTVRRGSFRKEDVNDWMTLLLQEYRDSGHNLHNLVLICDNAPCHALCSD